MYNFMFGFFLSGYPLIFGTWKTGGNVNLPLLYFEKWVIMHSVLMLTQLSHSGCGVKIAFGELQIRVAQTHLLWMILATFAQAQTSVQSDTSTYVGRSVQRWWRHFLKSGRRTFVGVGEKVVFVHSWPNAHHLHGHRAPLASGRSEHKSNS